VTDKAKFKSSLVSFITTNQVLLGYVLVYACVLCFLEVGMGDIANVQTRYLLPMYPFFILLSISLMYFVYTHTRVPLFQRATLGICMILIFCFVVGQATASLSVIGEKGGRYYTDPVWYDESVEEYQWVMENLPKGAEVFSNNPRALQFHMSRLVIPLPKKDDGAYAQKLLRNLHPGHLIVSLKGKKSNNDYMNAEELFSYNQKLSNPVQYSQAFISSDATVYQIISNAS
ncbi:MAG: hypothetical protein V1862_13195, partial [Methanobacteriota archaeon]